VIDNPCNDDASCDPLENTWRGCVCAANGDTKAQAACDATFAAYGSKAQDVVDCARKDCSVCYGSGTVTCKLSACVDSCIKPSCGDKITACMADGTCKAANSAVGPCMCNAQLGTGTTDACITTFTTAGGALATAVIDCVKSNCAAQCGL
jgi:hypothetical protein